jgi:beta-glucuronidase
MLAWHHNHPSIIMWGFLNECESSTARGRKEHTRMARLIKTTDPSRPTVFASNQADRDLCAGIPDIVAWNRYDAWYNEGIETTEPKLKAMFRWLDSPKSGGGRGKPVILSEFGAGAFYGCRKANHPKWSEEYQAETLDEALRVFLNHPGVVGTAIWQFSDVRATQGLWNVRPREYNNKGIVDEYRRAKLAYDVVKKRHLEAKRKYE